MAKFCTETSVVLVVSYKSYKFCVRGGQYCLKCVPVGEQKNYLVMFVARATVSTT